MLRTSCSRTCNGRGIPVAGEPASLDAARAALVDQHADVVASLLVNLRQMLGLHMARSDQGDDVHGRVRDDA